MDLSLDELTLRSFYALFMNHLLQITERTAFNLDKLKLVGSYVLIFKNGSHDPVFNAFDFIDELCPMCSII